MKHFLMNLAVLVTALVCSSGAWAFDVNYNCSEGSFKLVYEQIGNRTKMSFNAYDFENEKSVFNLFNFQYDSDVSKLTYDRGDGKTITEAQTTEPDGQVTLGNLSLKDPIDSGGIDYSFGERARLDFNLNGFREGFLADKVTIAIVVPKVVMSTVQNDILQATCWPRFDSRYKQYLIENIKPLEAKNLSPIKLALMRLQADWDTYLIGYRFRPNYDDVLDFVKVLIDHGADLGLVNSFAWGKLLGPLHQAEDDQLKEIYRKARYFTEHKKFFEILLSDQNLVPEVDPGWIAKLPLEHECYVGGRTFLYSCRYRLDEKKAEDLIHDSNYLEIVSRLKNRIAEQFGKSNPETHQLKFDPFQYLARGREEMHLEVLTLLSKATKTDFHRLTLQAVDLRSEAKKEFSANVRNFCRQVNIYFQDRYMHQLVSPMPFWDAEFMTGNPPPAKRFADLKNDLKAFNVQLNEHDINEVWADLAHSAEKLKSGTDEYLDMNRPFNYGSLLFDRERHLRDSSSREFEKNMRELNLRYSNCMQAVYESMKTK